MQVQNTNSDPTDEQLLELNSASDSNEYLVVLYNRYIPLIYGLGLKYLRNPDDASDAVIDIFEELTVKIRSQQIRTFRTWIYTVAKNHCLQKLRRRGREIPTDSSEQVMELASVEHLLDSRDDEQLMRALQECMDKLPEKQRRCIDLFYFADKSYADIVAETRYGLSGVKSYLQNAKRNLKNCIESDRQ